MGHHKENTGDKPYKSWNCDESFRLNCHFEHQQEYILGRNLNNAIIIATF